jgi:hypothetical protein
MADVIFVGVIGAFFALCVAYIRWCDRVIGPDELPAPVVGDTDGADVLGASPVGAAVTV